MRVRKAALTLVSQRLPASRVRRDQAVNLGVSPGGRTTSCPIRAADRQQVTLHFNYEKVRPGFVSSTVLHVIKQAWTHNLWSTEDATTPPWFYSLPEPLLQYKQGEKRQNSVMDAEVIPLTRLLQTEVRSYGKSPTNQPVSFWFLSRLINSSNYQSIPFQRCDPSQPSYCKHAEVFSVACERPGAPSDPVLRAEFPPFAYSSPAGGLGEEGR